MNQVFSLVGSRALEAKFAPLVGQVISYAIAEGANSFCVPCGRGTAQYARAAVAEQGATLRVFAASAVPLPSFVQRLVVRSRACVKASQVVVAFLASPSSVGTLGEIAFAISLGLPVVAFTCGFPVSLLPAFGGAWVREDRFGTRGWQWVSGQTSFLEKEI
jgi:hypothetical protein